MKRMTVIAVVFISLLLYAVAFAQASTGTVNDNANLRAGPGTTFAIVGKATKGQAVTIVGKNTAGDWYELEGDQWIAAFLVTLDAAPAVATPTKSASKATPTASTPVDIHNDPATQTYIAGLGEATDYFIGGSEIIGERFSEVATNPSIMLTDDWKTDVVLALASLQLSSNGVRELEPPAYLADLHTDLLTMADHIDSSVALISEGLDEFDGDKLNVGASEYQLAVDAMKSAQAKLTIIVASITPTPTPAPTKPPATPTRRATATKTPRPAATATGVAANCDPSYPDVCIAPAPPDLDCKDIPYRGFKVLPPDPHKFDGGNKDGIGCPAS